MSIKRTSMIASALTAALCLSATATFAQSATTFSGEAVALKANAVGIAVALADTGALPSSGGSLSTSVASANVAGVASADVLIVGLTVAGQSILVANPNLSISLPGGISVIINQQTSSSGGTSGSITVNALHVTGPGIDIVVGSAESDITCS